MNHQTSHPPSDMDQNETTPSVKCWTAFRHPPSQDLVLGRIRSPSCALRWTDWAHPPSRFGLVPILNKAALKVLDGSTLPPFGVEIGFKKRTGLLCDLLDAPGPTPLRGTRSLFNLEAPSCAICWTRFSYPPSDLTPLRLFGKSEYPSRRGPGWTSAPLTTQIIP